MTTDTFWTLIEDSRAHAESDGEKQAAILQQMLEQLAPSEIESFDRIYDEMRRASYENGLWAAAYILDGGCSDDGFEYFRGWLIAQGQKVFESALRDPESLADVILREGPTDNYELEDMLYLARRAYENKTGMEMPVRESLEWKLTGPEWDEDSVDELYPKLARAVETLTNGASE